MTLKAEGPHEAHLDLGRNRQAARLAYIVSDHSSSRRTLGFVVGAILATMDAKQRQSVASLLEALLLRDDLGRFRLSKYGRMSVENVVDELLKE